eukprot:266219_1
MKSLLSWIAFLYLVTCFADSGKNQDDIQSGYSKCSNDDLEEIQLMVDLLRSDLIVLIDEVGTDSSLKVIGAKKQVVAVEGTNYHATFKVNGYRAYTVSFYVPDDDDEKLPRDAKLIQAPTNSDSESKEETLPGGWQQCEDECLDDRKKDVREMEDEIRELLDLDDKDEVIVVSASQQVVAGMNYRARLTIEDKDEAEIQYYVDLAEKRGNPLLVVNGEVIQIAKALISADAEKEYLGAHAAAANEDPSDSAESKSSSSETMDDCGCPLTLAEVCCSKPGSNQPGITYATLCNAECHDRLPQHCEDGPCSLSARPGGGKKIDYSDESDSKEDLQDYISCDSQEVVLVQGYLNVVRSDVLALLNLDVACALDVESCEFKESNGVLFIASVEECEGEATVSFFVPTEEEDPERKPKDIK